MKVSPHEPFQIIYSIYSHEYLGYLFESYLVQCNEAGKLTLKHQNISYKNAEEFASGLDERDYEIIRWIDQMQQDEICRKFSGKKTEAKTFLIKVYDKQKGDKILQETIENYVQGLKAKVLGSLGSKFIFETGTDGEPTYKRIFLAEEKATVLFHFMRNEDNTHYFPTIKYKGEKLDFAGKGSAVICNRPAWLLCDGILYHFEQEIEGNKLKPFSQKRFVSIPKKMEDEYYRKFVSQIIAGFDVHAKGFEIKQSGGEPIAVLQYSGIDAGRQEALFAEEDGEHTSRKSNSSLLFELQYRYNDFSFHANTMTPSYVKMEKKDDDITFYKVKRATQWERQQLEHLRSHGLVMKHGKANMGMYEGISWLNESGEKLKSLGIEVQQSATDTRKFYLGERSVEVSIEEGNDWFDIKVVVRFGSFEIPFIKLREYILAGQKEFALPDGSIAYIPEAWFTHYLELASFSQIQDGQLVLKKHHFAVVHHLQTGELARVSMVRKLEGLRNFDEIEDVPIPETFKGTLRPYQKAGYNWMQFLKSYRLGGCLADDMGLGKTIQTLALLADASSGKKKKASLLVMPTSLIYNWEAEAKKFTPSLKLLVHTGSTREKSGLYFDHYDLIITSYGLVRMDIAWLSKYNFHYIILDESQAIKNPTSGTAQAVRLLSAEHKLILTGTPIENTVLDIWSQMNFINPGLLGNATFFKKHFQTPIEKKKDQATLIRLQTLIKPFILRRHKSQVAKELPEKIENLSFCTMSSEQAEAYDKAKSFFRNELMKRIEETGLRNSQIFLLQGLSMLRQLANHPSMVQPDYTYGSGKMEDAMHKIESILQNDHKILIFSQYVKHLQLIKKELETRNVRYLYLDGSTHNRMELVNEFQKSKGACVFLMSLKAGGVGLNLTSAEYVFIMDPWWNPASEAQAIDRAHRIGQNKTVVTYKFISKDTVEEKILQLQESKNNLLAI